MTTLLALLIVLGSRNLNPVDAPLAGYTFATLFAGSFAFLARRFFVEFAANRFIFRRARRRGLAHWPIMWGGGLAAAITFPLVRERR
jgi:hypothetical protein